MLIYKAEIKQSDDVLMQFNVQCYRNFVCEYLHLKFCKTVLG